MLVCCLIGSVSECECMCVSSSRVVMNFATAVQVGGWWVLTVAMRVKQGRSSLEEAFGYTNLNGLLRLLVLVVISASGLLVCWAALRGFLCERTIHVPRRRPVVGSLLGMGGQAQGSYAVLHKATALALMALILGATWVVIASRPETAREILDSAAFADRPVNQSAQQLLFRRAVKVAPFDDYWRGLRRIAADHVIAPKHIAAHGSARLVKVQHMLAAISQDLAKLGRVQVRDHLQRASMNNMGSVFGRRYETRSPKFIELNAQVHEGFEFPYDWAEHFPILKYLDAQRIHQRCAVPVPRVTAFVLRPADEHQERRVDATKSYETYFVAALLSLSGDEKLADEGMIAVLWEMLFRGTDTTATLTEWLVAAKVLHPEIQRKVQKEVDAALESGCLDEIELARVPYLQAVINKTLHLHPMGPRPSCARLSRQDVYIASHRVPVSTKAMVNMYAITHNSEPESFDPKHYLEQDADVRGNELRLAPFSAGHGVCPGRALGLATVQLWMAQLLVGLARKMDPEDAEPLSIYKSRPKPILRPTLATTAGARPEYTVDG